MSSTEDTMPDFLMIVLIAIIFIGALWFLVIGFMPKTEKIERAVVITFSILSGVTAVLLFIVFTDEVMLDISSFEANLRRGVYEW